MPLTSDRKRISRSKCYIPRHMVFALRITERRKSPEQRSELDAVGQAALNADLPQFNAP